MTRSEKKAVIESMAEKFMNIDDLEGKSMTIMVMSAYAELVYAPCEMGEYRIVAGERRWEALKYLVYRTMWRSLST